MSAKDEKTLPAPTAWRMAKDLHALAKAVGQARPFSRYYEAALAFQRELVERERTLREKLSFPRPERRPNGKDPRS